MEIPKKDYETIAEYIQNADSPVGIDAKKTHVYIIHTLHNIQMRLAALERQAAKQKGGPAKVVARNNSKNSKAKRESAKK